MSDNLKTKKIIRWGIIGCGNVTEIKSGPPYQQTNGFQLKAVMRRNEEKAKDYAKRHKVEKYYANADDLINDNDIDAVYIATPPDSHLFYALKVAATNKPCCIEKPLSPSYKDSLEIYNAFKKSETPLFVAYYRRSLPRFKQIHTWLKNNEIGEVRHISWSLCKAPSNTDLSKNYNWRTDSKVAPGGYFDDLASHGLDLFSFLLGDIKEAHGISLNQQQLYTSEDAITACWIHESGVTGSGNWSFGTNTNEDIVKIIGSKGTIQFSIFDDNPVCLKTTTKTEETFIEHPKHVQMFHVEAMRDELIKKGSKHPSTGQSALHTSWVMDKILGNI